MPPELRDVLADCFHQNPEARPTAAEIRAEVNRRQQAESFRAALPEDICRCLISSAQGVLPGWQPAGRPPGAARTHGHRLRPHRTRPLWEQDLGDWIQSVTAVSQNRVLALTLSGTAWLLDEETGAVRWSGHVEGRPTGAPAVVDGRACIGTADGTVHVLDLDNTRWLRGFTVDGRVTACLASGRTVIVAGPSLRALSPRTGAVSWEKPIAATVPHGLAAQGGVVYAGTATGYVHALDVSSGTARRTAWSIGQRVLTVAPGPGDVVFVTDAGGGVLALLPMRAVCTVTS